MGTVKKYAISAVMGLLVGVCTVIGQSFLPINLNFLANSGAVWLIPAFLFSFFVVKDRKLHSVLVTVTCLLGCVYGYYVFEAIYNQHPFSVTGGVLTWSVMALLAGSVFGMGAYFANQESSKLKYGGMNLLPAVFAAEGIDHVLHIAGYLHMVPAVIMKIVIGCLLYLVINRKDAVKGKNLLSFGILTALGVIAYEMLALGMRLMAS